MSKCDKCFKRKTILCPNSIKCFSKENKPYFVNDSRMDIVKYVEQLQKELNTLSMSEEEWLDESLGDE